MQPLRAGRVAKRQLDVLVNENLSSDRYVEKRFVIFESSYYVFFKSEDTDDSSETFSSFRI